MNEVIGDVFESFKQSLDRLEEALKAPKTTIARDSAIKRFELAFELSWKLLQRVLKEKGIVCNSPRDCFQAAFKQNWIKDDAAWLEMIKDRNLTVHTYDEKQAESIYSHLSVYQKLFKQLMSVVGG